MPTLYKLLSALVALTGNVSLIITGELSPIFIAIGFVMLIGYYRALKDKPQAPGLVIGGMSTIALLIFFTDAIVITEDIIIGVAHLSLLFHSIKSFDLKTPWDPLQVFFMSLLQLLIASEFTRSIVFGVVFIIFIIIMVFSLSYSHLIKEKNLRIRTFIKPILTITVMILLITVLFFISLPRLKGRLWGKSLERGIKSGFSETVKLGSFGKVKIDSTIVMRVTLEPNIVYTPYWRGIVYETYKEDSWHNTKKNRKDYLNPEGVFIIKDSEQNRLIKQDIMLEPLDTDIIFTLKNSTKLITESRYLLKDREGSLFIPKKRSKRIRYTALSTDASILAIEIPHEYLQLPDGIDQIRILTEKVIKGTETALESARKIERYLNENYTYSLIVSPPPEGVSPIDDFIFRKKSGFCEHYATSMVLMLRSVDIPARVVSGFLGGEYNNYGNYYIVRQSNAHTWVEAIIDSKWITFDPTPPEPIKKKNPIFLYMDLLKHKWERYVMGYSRYDQLRIIRSFSQLYRFPERINIDIPKTSIIYFFLFVIIIIVSFIFFRVFRIKKRKRYMIASRYYLDIRKRLKKRISIKDSYTANDIFINLDKIDHYNKTLIYRFIDIYYKIRFGNVKDSVLMKRYEDIYKSLKKEI